MALGKIVIGPEHSGFKEAVISDEYGFLYKPNSLESLVECTQAALESEYREIRENAQRRAAENYDWKIIGERLDSIYG